MVYIIVQPRKQLQIVMKFEETRVVKNIERPKHHRFARSAENIAIVSENVAETRLCPFISVLRNQNRLTAHYGLFCI